MAACNISDSMLSLDSEKIIKKKILSRELADVTKIHRTRTDRYISANANN